MKAELGRRERKKIEAMHHIQRVALDLFEADGYDAVTIERIAAEAEVSPSSVYRYFGTKERIVLYDEYDPQLVEAFDRELAGHDPVTALQGALSTVFREIMREDEELIRRRIRLAMNHPTVRSELIRDSEETEAQVRAIIARRTGRSADDLDILVVTAAIVRAFMAALSYWHTSGYQEPLDEVVDRTLTVIRRGLTLD
ncbi:TetR/AcrR family transcriptional regulator [Phytoactinopolyspora halotolerans]|uniref:TetR family transcriptional regulator n=1 Tax=Phytoactinopolyspora halotolerans TaxID=1981512 RepID=A0A6L9S128_9ACTN|nr:TetR family transcriptional regulator [Phytoactinopolyspora halotolerans]NED98736.1 TetR family transcriptional regulator [Phytoactinopolyspora halotolerans]